MNENQIALAEYRQQIEDAIQDGRYQEALAHGRHILEWYPNDVDAYWLLGRTMLEAGEDDEAADMFERVLSADPEHVSAWVGMSELAKRRGDLEDAIHYLQRAFELATDNDAVAEELRYLYGELEGSEPKRLQLTESALAKLYLRGDLLTRAIAELRKLIEEHPERLDLQVALAEAYWRDGQRLQASQLCQEILDEDPYVLKANLILGEIWSSSGRKMAAQPYLDRAEALDPGNQLAQNLFGAGSPLPPTEPHIEPLAYEPEPSEAAEKGLAELEEAAPAEDEQDVEAEMVVPDWLEEARPPGEPPAPEQIATQALEEKDILDWLAELEEEEPTPWLHEGLDEGEIPAWLAEIEALADEEGPAPEGEEAPEGPEPTEIPEWLEDLVPPDEELPTAALEGEMDEAEPAAEPKAEEIALEGPQAERPSLEALAETEALPDWMETADLPSAEEALTWLARLGEEEEEELAPDEAIPEAPEMPPVAEEEAPPAEEEPALAPAEEEIEPEPPTLAGEEELLPAEEAIPVTRQMPPLAEEEAPPAEEEPALAPAEEELEPEPPTVAEEEELLPAEEAIPVTRQMPPLAEEEAPPVEEEPALAPAEEEIEPEPPTLAEEEELLPPEEAIPVTRQMPPVAEREAPPREQEPVPAPEEAAPAEEAMEPPVPAPEAKEEEIAPEEAVPEAPEMPPVAEEEAPPPEQPALAPEEVRPIEEVIAPLPSFLEVGGEAFAPQEPMPEPPEMPPLAEEEAPPPEEEEEVLAPEEAVPEAPEMPPAAAEEGPPAEEEPELAPEEVALAEAVRKPLPPFLEEEEDEVALAEAVPEAPEMPPAAVEEGPPAEEEPELAPDEAVPAEAVRKPLPPFLEEEEEEIAPEEMMPEAPPEDLERFIATRKAYAEEHPDDHEAQLELGRVLWQLDERQDAVEAYDKLIERRELLDDVIADLEDYTEQSPDARVMQSLGDAYVRSDRLQDALDTYRGALASL